MAPLSERFALALSPLLLVACGHLQPADEQTFSAHGVSPHQPKDYRILSVSQSGTVASIPNAGTSGVSTWMLAGGLAKVMDRATGETRFLDCEQMSGHLGSLIIAQAYTTDFSAHLKYSVQSILVSEAMHGMNGMNCPAPRKA